MNTAAKGIFKETQIEVTIMRVIPPESGDPRPWQRQQCPHCQGIFWSWAKGVVSYWHQNPVKRLLFWINSFGKG